MLCYTILILHTMTHRRQSPIPIEWLPVPNAGTVAYQEKVSVVPPLLYAIGGKRYGKPTIRGGQGLCDAAWRYDGKLKKPYIFGIIRTTINILYFTILYFNIFL